MEWLIYLVTPVAVIGMLVYMQVARKRVMGQVAAGNGGQLFHDSQAGYFSHLGPRERIIAVWQGQAHVAAQSTAGKVLNAVAEHAVGISKYTPTVMVALTTDGRVMVSEEYSEVGTRGHYKTVVILPPGARAITGPSAIAEHQGPPPKNQMNVMQQLEAVALIAPDGSLAYKAWLSPIALAGANLAQSIGTVLPFNPAMGPQIWATVNPGSPQL
jgi:hypothetical protein